MAQPLRRQILALNIAVLIPVFAAAAWSTRETYNEQIKQLECEAATMSALILFYLEQASGLSDIQTVIGTIPLPQSAVIMITDADSVVLAESPRGAMPSGSRSLKHRCRPRRAAHHYSRRDGRRRTGLRQPGIRPRAVAGERRDSDGPRAPADGAVDPPQSQHCVQVRPWLTILLGSITRPYKFAFDRATGFASNVAAGESSQDHPHAVARDGSSSEHLVTMVDSLREAREKLAAQVAEERRIREEPGRSSDK